MHFSGIKNKMRYLMKYLVIVLGGGTGALFRYVLSRYISTFSNGSFPIGTLIINLTGCFLIGLLSGLFDFWIIPPNLRLPLI